MRLVSACGTPATGLAANEAAKAQRSDEEHGRPPACCWRRRPAHGDQALHARRLHALAATTCALWMLSLHFVALRAGGDAHALQPAARRSANWTTADSSRTLCEIVAETGAAPPPKITAEQRARRISAAGRLRAPVCLCGEVLGVVTPSTTVTSPRRRGAASIGQAQAAQRVVGQVADRAFHDLSGLLTRIWRPISGASRAMRPRSAQSRDARS
jgi:hypothetical protein